MTAAVTRRVVPKPSRTAQRRRHAKRQRSYRDRQKAKMAAAVALLAQIGDDDRIVIVGSEAE